MNVKLRAFFGIRGVEGSTVGQLTERIIAYVEHLERQNAALRCDLRLADAAVMDALTKREEVAR